MINVIVHSDKGIHSQDWKDFKLGQMPKDSTIDTVFSKFGEHFASGYHYYNIRFKYNGKVLPFATKLSDLTKETDIVLEGFEKEGESSNLPTIDWKPIDSNIQSKITEEPRKHVNASDGIVYLILDCCKSISPKTWFIVIVLIFIFSFLMQYFGFWYKET